MKRLLMTALVALSLVGCGESQDPDAGKPDPWLSERTITLTDGRTITCVIFEAGYAGGVSCDWAEEGQDDG